MQPDSLAVVSQAKSCADLILAEFARLIGRHSFEHWFHRKSRFQVAASELTVHVASPFLLRWMQKQFKPAATQAARAVLGAGAEVKFAVECAETAPTGHAAPSAPAGRAAIATRVAPPTAASPAPTVHERGIARTGRRFADLSDFVVGPCNEMALAAAFQACQSPGMYNPLYIYGPVGTGKTHLLEGVYRQLRRTQPALQVLFLSCEAFTNHFTQALREHTLPAFRQRFRTVDVLIVDDIDFLDAKRGIQEEFLHTFKQLEACGRQIVVAADRHPRLLSKMGDELITRFLSGMVCRLEAPDAATRRNIVVRKARRLNADFSPEALEFVADRFTNNVRELEGALNCLQTWQAMTGKRVGITAARQVLAELERDCIRVVRLADIERVVCDVFGIDAAALKSDSRNRSLAQPRMLAMYLARKHTRAAYSEIGQHFGGRNHSTVISAERRIGDWAQRQLSIRIASHSLQVGDVLESIEQQLLVG